ncbi:MAG TPA: methanol dehydrogenase [Candidatus Omnitrophica bacterium]|nr:MAG: hypothetical protein A2Z81_01845 [Omnitrophica WOR_2 bacterium GWA2_45_18]HBR14385.1 methanol dehydrogenase [Candidatus Omnitrophota bacterium]
MRSKFPGYPFLGALILFVLGSFFADAQQPYSPALPRGYVSDFAQVMKGEDQKSIEAFARELEDKTSDQLAVVTVQTTSPESIEEYAVELFKKWGIGQKGKDNGVLLLVSIQDRRVRIETGYGVEEILPDILCDKIIRDRMIPSFKSARYSQGIRDGAAAIVSVIAKAKGLNITGQENQVVDAFQSQEESPDSLFWVFLIFFIAYIIMKLFWLSWFISGHDGRRGRYEGWYGSGGGGFSGGGGGFGGGFGGFGGGMSGGGGASGRW